MNFIGSINCKWYWAPSNMSICEEKFSCGSAKNMFFGIFRDEILNDSAGRLFVILGSTAHARTD